MSVCGGCLGCWVVFVLLIGVFFVFYDVGFGLGWFYFVLRMIGLFWLRVLFSRVV